MTPQEVLLKAAEYIEEHGWCQHAFGEPDGRVCLEGAINRTAYNGSERDAAVRRMIGHLNGQTPAFWNDMRGRTKEEVIAALREAAK